MRCLLREPCKQPAGSHCLLCKPQTACTAKRTYAAPHRASACTRGAPRKRAGAPPARIVGPELPRARYLPRASTVGTVPRDCAARRAIISIASCSRKHADARGHTRASISRARIPRARMRAQYTHVYCVARHPRRARAHRRHHQLLQQRACYLPRECTQLLLCADRAVCRFAVCRPRASSLAVRIRASDRAVRGSRGRVIYCVCGINDCVWNH